MPFFATVGAALTLLLLQFITRRVTDKRKKLYAAAYILNICYHIQSSAFILQKHTVIPHIEATKRIINGDVELLETMFGIDDFDILNARPMDYNHLTEEYKILLGMDNLDMVQMVNTLKHFVLNDTNRLELNSFVKDNLKSRSQYFNQRIPKRNDILKTYLAYLERIEHDNNRLIAFISMRIVPTMSSYIKECQFSFHSKKSAKAILLNLKTDQEKNEDLIPQPSFFESSIRGGIQSVI